MLPAATWKRRHPLRKRFRPGVRPANWIKPHLGRGVFEKQRTAPDVFGEGGDGPVPSLGHDGALGRRLEEGTLAGLPGSLGAPDPPHHGPDQDFLGGRGEARHLVGLREWGVGLPTFLSVSSVLSVPVPRRHNSVLNISLRQRGIRSPLFRFPSG